MVLAFTLFLSFLLLLDSLTKKVLSFILFILILLPLLENWTCYLLLLVYVGGLFILVVYMSTFSYSSGEFFLMAKFFFIILILSSLKLLGPTFTPSISGFWSLGLEGSSALWGILLAFLLVVFITISKVFQQGKVGRNLSAITICRVGRFSVILTW